MTDIKVPEFGDSIQEVQVFEWLKQPGEWVERDEDLVELESEKASQTLPSSVAGVVKNINVGAGEIAKIGQVLCVVDENAARPAGAAAATPAQTAQAAGSTAVADAPPVKQAPPAPTGNTGNHDSFVMPAAERVLSEYKISASAIAPTGPGGRLLKEDVLNYVKQHGLRPGGSVGGGVDGPLPTPSPVGKPPVASGVVASAQSAAVNEWNDTMSPEPREETAKPMSMIRRTIAKRLVEAQQTAALLTTFNEIDMQPVKELRGKYKEAFQKKHGVKLGFMSFFAKAAVEGLKRFPAINSEIRGNEVITKNFHDIGIAIGGGKGLVVPILRNVERMSFADIERQIGVLAGMAQENKLKPKDLDGGTFTISNGGVYGSLLSTPIVNPPQSGILGLHTIQDRPVAVNGEVVIRPMMYVALTYDHRIVDGREAVSFLKTIKEVLEEPARLFLEV